MTEDRFWRRVGSVIVDCFSFAMAQDEALIEKKMRWDASAESIARVLDGLVGFGILDGTRYDYGIVHPEMEKDILGGEARKNIGQSMIDAFSPFDRAFRHAYSSVRYEEVFRKHQRECNIVTFGSPSSNAIARANLGYLSDPDGGFVLRQNFGPERYGVRYDLSDDRALVKRNGGAYFEPQWSLDTPEERLETQLSSAGSLTSDYLVISCVPNLLSTKTLGILEAQAELDDLRRNPDHLSEYAGSTEKVRELAKLEEAAAPGIGGMHRVLIIGGLHGPGTAATRLLLSDPRRAKMLERRVREERVDGKFWQAVIKVDEVARNPDTKRDFPKELSDRIDIFPVNIA